MAARATDKQIWLIKKLGRELGFTVDGDAEDMSHVLTLTTREHWASLPVYEASNLINKLKAMENETPQLDEATWLDAIEDVYGVRLSEGTRPYATKVKGEFYVYAGSEFVAVLDGRNTDPEAVKEWSENLGHMPRGGKGVETAKSNALTCPNCGRPKSPTNPSRYCSRPDCVSGEEWGAF